MVSEVCAGGYSAGRIGARSTRGAEGLVGRSASRAAVGVAQGSARGTVPAGSVRLEKSVERHRAK